MKQRIKDWLLGKDIDNGKVIVYVDGFLQKFIRILFRVVCVILFPLSVLLARWYFAHSTKNKVLVVFNK